LVFRRVQAIAPTDLAFEMVDSVSGQPLEEAGVLVCQGRDGVEAEWFSSGDEPSEWKVREDTYFIAGAPGHRCCRGSLVNQMDNAAGVVRIELEPGLSRMTLVVDGDTEQPLPGAEVLVDGVAVGETGPDGRMLVEGPLAGAKVVVRKEGYKNTEWWPDDEWEEFSWTWASRVWEEAVVWVWPEDEDD